MTNPADNHDALRWAVEVIGLHTPEIVLSDAANSLRLHQLRLLRDEMQREARK